MQSVTSSSNTVIERSPAPARRPSVEHSSPGGQRRPSISGDSTAQRRPSQRSGSQPGSPALAQRRPSGTRSTSTSSNPETLQRSSSILNMIFGASSSKGEIKCKESDIKAITRMGFSREQAVWALSQNDHNVTMALNSLTR